MQESSDELFGDPELHKLLDEAIDRELSPPKQEKNVPRDNTNFGPDELKARFGQRIPTDTTKKMHAAVHGIVTDVAVILDRMLPNGRAKFQALVELEKVLMWANTSIGDMEPLSDG